MNSPKYREVQEAIDNLQEAEDADGDALSLFEAGYFLATAQVKELLENVVIEAAIQVERKLNIA